MNEGQIIELFVKAAEVERKLPNTAKPATMKAMNLGYVHSFADMNGWDQAQKDEWRWSWLDPTKARATTNDVGIWQAAMEVVTLVPCSKKRRALWAWAKAEAGGRAFAAWCRDVEGISRQLGDWRKNAAIESIVSAFQRKPLLHNDKAEETAFTNQPEIEDKKSNIAVWRPDESKPLRCYFDTDLDGFDWSEKRNQQRRQRNQRKQEAA